MKKYYGPIVLGIAALTVAAPVVNATTVLAGTETGQETTGDTDKTETDTGTDTSTVLPNQLANKTAITTALNKLNDQLAKYNGVTPTITAAKDFVTKSLAAVNQEQGLTNDENDDYSNKIIDQQKNLVNNITTSNYDLSITKSGADTPTTVSVENVPYENGKTTTAILIPDTTADQGTLSLSLDKDNKATFTPSEGATFTVDTTKDPTSTPSASDISNTKDFINDTISNLSPFFAPTDKTTSDNFLKPLYDELAKLDDANITAADLANVKKAVNDYVANNTTTMQLHNSSSYKGNVDRTQTYVPVVKGGTVYVPDTNHDLNVAVTYDDNGKIKSTSSAKGYTVSSQDVPVKITLPDGTVFPEQKKDTSTTNNNHHNSNSNNTVTEPEQPAKPEHNKSVSAHHITFYVLPNTTTVLYDDNGQVLKNRALGGNSSWMADKLMTIDDVPYVRVATGEWAKLKAGLEITPLNNTISTKNDSRLFTAEGKVVKSRALAKNTSWRTDKSATINGQTMYRVATNEWVSAYDLK